MSDFNFIDIERINKSWAYIEERVKKHPFEVTGFPLSIQRVGRAIRVCYNGRPISECKAEEKVAATQYLEEFLMHYETTKTNLAQQANVAAALLESYSGKFK